MDTPGKYVRAPVDPETQSSEDELDQDNLEDLDEKAYWNDSDLDESIDIGSERSVESSRSSDPGTPVQNNAGNTSTENTSATPLEHESNRKPSKTSERLQRVESVLADLTKALSVFQTKPTVYPDTDQNWSSPVVLRNPSDSLTPSVRWDNIKPFPCGVPANKMWEEWNRYIENFEIAATLNHANDPVQRSLLLFLSIGDELQGIIRAAKLRPSLSDANCYHTLVSNIKN